MLRKIHFTNLIGNSIPSPYEAYVEIAYQYQLPGESNLTWNIPARYYLDVATGDLDRNGNDWVQLQDSYLGLLPMVIRIRTVFTNGRGQMIGGEDQTYVFPDGTGDVNFSQMVRVDPTPGALYAAYADATRDSALAAQSAATDALASANQALETAASVPLLFSAPSPTSPRPPAAPGQEVWWKVVSSDPDVPVPYAIDGDIIIVVAPEPVPFTWAQLDGLGGLYHASHAGVANGADLATGVGNALHDESGNARHLTVLTGTGIADIPTYSAAAGGGNGAILFPQVSALRSDTMSITPSAVIVAVNAKFNSPAASTADQTVFTLGGTGSGKFSLSREGATDTKLQVASADGTTLYQSGVLSFTSEMSIICVWLPTRVRVFVNGTAVIDVTTTAQTLTTITQMFVGVVVTGSSSAVLRAFRDGELGMLAWATPGTTAFVTDELIEDINGLLMAERNA
jgi:hypothetical protein